MILVPNGEITTVIDANTTQTTTSYSPWNINNGYVGWLIMIVAGAGLFTLFSTVLGGDDN